MSCKGKIGHTCGKKHPAKCIDYEGTYHNNTELEECDCNNIEDVIEDINSELNDINESIDLSVLGESCIEYEQEGDTLKVGEALLAFEAQICELVDYTGINEPEPCPGCTDDPCGQGEGCCQGLVHYGYSGGEFFTSNTYSVWGLPTFSGYDFLSFNVPKDGTYKVTLDIGCGEEDTGGRAEVGVSINNADPLPTAFAQQTIIPNFNSHTFHFIVPNVKATDNLRVVFKENASGVIVIDGIKLIVEKIG